MPPTRATTAAKKGTKSAPAKGAVAAKTSASITKVSSTTGPLTASAQGVSNAARARAEALLSEIARRKGRIAEDFYEIGEALRELSRKKLYAALGHATFAEMLSARNVMSTTQARKLIALVSSVPREKALAAGSEKAALLVDYAKATAEPDTAEWLLDHGRLPDGKKVSDASTREIAEAAKTARAEQGRTRKKTAPEIQGEKAARAAQALLRKRGAQGAKARAVRRSGETWLHIELREKDAKALEG